MKIDIQKVRLHMPEKTKVIPKVEYLAEITKRFGFRYRYLETNKKLRRLEQSTKLMYDPRRLQKELESQAKIVRGYTVQDKILKRLFEYNADHT